MKLLYTLCTCLLLTLSQSSFAQKFGHANLGNILEMMPDVKKSDIELETYRVQLVKQLEEKYKSFEEKVAALRLKINNKEISPVKQKEEEEVLGKLQQELGLAEREMQQKILAKRQEMLQPILDKVNVALQEIGKENGYTMIFDTSQFNAILFAKDSEDVTALVRAKLNF